MRVRIMIGLICLIGAGAWAGCGPSFPEPPPATKETPKVGPHGGTAFVLPDDQGYVEVVNEPPVEARGAAKPTAIVAYFLAPDLKAAASSAPAGVKFATKSGSSSTALTLNARADDPAGAYRFATSPGSYSLNDLRGELIGTMGGKPFRCDLAGIR